MKANNRNRRIVAINAASHRRSVEAAAAADRHARDFTAMFSIGSPVEALEPSGQYLADLKVRGRQ
jgi:hypothetical protein